MMQKDGSDWESKNVQDMTIQKYVVLSCLLMLHGASKSCFTFAGFAAKESSPEPNVACSESRARID